MTRDELALQLKALKISVTNGKVKKKDIEAALATAEEDKRINKFSLIHAETELKSAVKYIDQAFAKLRASDEFTPELEKLLVNAQKGAQAAAEDLAARLKLMLAALVQVLGGAPKLKEKAAIKFTRKESDGKLIIYAKDGDKNIGEVVIYDEYLDAGGECEPFSSYEGEKFYEDICGYEVVVNIQHLKVKPEYRGEGLASQLMDKAMKHAKKRWPGEPAYINASPMGGSISLEDLITFYKKYGFKVLKKYPEHRNALLWKDKL